MNKRVKNTIINTIVVGGIYATIPTLMFNTVGVRAGNYQDVNTVAIMFTLYCNTCGQLAEGDYSFVSKKGQIWCNECGTWEDLDEDSYIIQDNFNRR